MEKLICKNCNSFKECKREAEDEGRFLRGGRGACQFYDDMPDSWEFGDDTPSDADPGL